jgi:hypothetical protein
MKLVKTLISVILAIVLALSLPLVALAHEDEAAAEEGPKTHELLGLSKEEYESLVEFMDYLEAAGGVIEVEGYKIRLFEFDTQEEIENFRLESANIEGGITEVHAFKWFGIPYRLDVYISNKDMEDRNMTMWIIGTLLSVIPGAGPIASFIFGLSWVILQEFDKDHGIIMRFYLPCIPTGIWSQEP